MFKFASATAAVFPRPTVSFPRPASVRAAAVPAALAAPARLDGPVSFRAEVRAKRLGGPSVRDDRYTATLPVSGRTPYELISALAEACAGIEELTSNEPGEERVVIEISLTSQAA